MISYLFNEIFYRPILNGLIFLYDIIPGRDLGIAIIVLTVIIRLILWPLTAKGLKNQKALARIQPDIAEIKKKYKDREAQAKALMALYTANEISPLGGLLPVIIQIPVIIALWRVFMRSANLDFGALYHFVAMPPGIHPFLLGAVDLSARSGILALLSGILQYFQAKMIIPKEEKKSAAPDFSRIMSKQMLYFMPIFSVVIFWSLLAALPLYWTVVTIMTIIQQYLAEKKFIKENERRTAGTN